MLVFVVFTLILFSPFLLKGNLPIPSDTIVNLYHPFRDSLAKEFPRGYPSKNPLITDPVRQQYPYRVLAIEQLKRGVMPLWNPYSFSGTPLLANIQTAVFYPLNLLYWIFDSPIAWSLQILLQPLLAGLFCYWYLRYHSLEQKACFVGALCFAFSGFMTVWMTWNTLGQVALWLPLVLLSKDKLLNRFSLKWAAVLIFSETSTILAGHLQTALYVTGFTSTYLIIRGYQSSNSSLKITFKKLIPFLITGAIVLVISSIQIMPTIKFILGSARNSDLSSWKRADWFIPWPNLVQFLVPDFFGNPATNNYWGVWNYAEFVGYIGIIPFIFSLSCLFFVHNKNLIVYKAGLIFSFIMAFPTILGKLPYQLQIPFISTAQPSRILILVDFCLAVLAAFGINDLLVNIQRKKQVYLKKLLFSLGGIAVVLSITWISVLMTYYKGQDIELIQKMQISLRNLVLPSILLFILSLYLVINLKFKHPKIFLLTTILLIGAMSIDNARFFVKFNPFTEKNLLFPKTATTTFLQNNLNNYRFMSMDRRIFAPNFSIAYKIQSVEGYDPLYLNKYADVIGVWLRGKPIVAPATFNRIITPQEYSSFWADFLGVKYIMSLKEEHNPKLKLVFQEGETRIYENTHVYPRVFLTTQVKTYQSYEIIGQLFAQSELLKSVAFTTNKKAYLEENKPLENDEVATLSKYSENQVIVAVQVNSDRILVLTDIYYPTWKVYIDDNPRELLEVDYLFRGVVVPKGKHFVRFQI